MPTRNCHRVLAYLPQDNHSGCSQQWSIFNVRLQSALLPGTEVAFEKEVEYEHGFFPTLKRAKKAGEKVARFRQVNTDEPHLHHDALEFPDGQIVLVTRLCEGQHAIVLQLPAAPRMRDAEDQKRVAIVA